MKQLVAAARLPPRPGRGGASRTHLSLERGLRIIEAAAANGGSITLTQVMHATGLPKSTAHHLLRALAAFGYLARDADARPYRLTARLLRLTGQRWSREQLAEAGEPFLDELSRRTGEGTSLAALRDGVVTIVAKRDHEGPVRVVQDVGATRPFHCTAVGKILAAWMPAQELEGVVARTVFRRMTERTIATPAAFRRELARIRARGHAIDDEEHLPGIRCIAVPVRDHSAEVVAALCLVGPRSRLPHRRLRELHGALAGAAARLSARLGHGGAAGQAGPSR